MTRPHKLVHTFGTGLFFFWNCFILQQYVVQEQTPPQPTTLCTTPLQNQALLKDSKQGWNLKMPKHRSPKGPDYFLGRLHRELKVRHLPRKPIRVKGARPITAQKAPVRAHQTSVRVQSRWGGRGSWYGLASVTWLGFPALQLPGVPEGKKGLARQEQTQLAKEETDPGVYNVGALTQDGGCVGLSAKRAAWSSEGEKGPRVEDAPVEIPLTRRRAHLADSQTSKLKSGVHSWKFLKN
ncbi:hypothetical protein EDB84DRAFT_1440349 [Lactarius hengduanensis]|nr:hypothetical protein EDB84DRAFT_1440349 [Lactarius hengduanensis]